MEKYYWFVNNFTIKANKIGFLYISLHAISNCIFMNKKRNLLLVLVLVLTATILTCTTKANNTADSIRMQMKHLTGEQLLIAHSNLCRLAAGQDNADEELAALSAYIDEARRQNDVEAEGQARTMQIMCYYNYDMDDRLKETLPLHLAFMRKHGLWDNYYNSWNTLVELHIYNDNLQTALLEADKMYTDAKENKSNYGIGVSGYCMGSIYQTMQRFTLAKQSLEESIVALSKEEDISLLLAAYNALGETLDGLGQYEQLRIVATEWKAILDNYKQMAEAKGYTPSLNGQYLNCTLAALVAEIETDQHDRATDLLAEAEALVDGRNMIWRYKFLQVQARYYAATKQYEKAIESNNENMAIIVSVGDSISLLTVELQQAHLLHDAGQHKEAAELYKQIIPRKDKLRNHELTMQLDELRTIFEVDKLTLKNQIATNRLYFLLVCSILLLTVVFLYIMYASRLRRKNRILFDTYVQSKKKEDKLSLVKEKVEQENLSNEEILYNKLNNLMQSEHLYRDQKMKKDEVVSKLNTNRTYLSDAIKECADGITFTEFINQYRLRYAATLLTGNLDMNIYEVADESGFNSRSTYNRLFQDYYGMSPSEFRDIAKEKKMGK